MHGLPTKSSILSVGIMEQIPMAVVGFILKYLPPRRMALARGAGELSTEVSKTLVEQKTAELLADKGRRDVMSLLGLCFLVISRMLCCSFVKC